MGVMSAAGPSQGVNCSHFGRSAAALDNEAAGMGVV